MKTVGIFLAGVVTGWALRSSFDSLRELAVSAVATGYEVAQRARRLVATEKEFFEDLVAEGRARYEASRRTAPEAAPAAVIVKAVA